MESITESKHTLGPWAAVQSRNNIAHINSITGTSGDIATAWGICGRDGMADARLIAAAPDLLKACRGLMELGTKSFTEDEHRKVIMAARAAIAKAEGVTP